MSLLKKPDLDKTDALSHGVNKSSEITRARDRSGNRSVTGRKSSEMERSGEAALSEYSGAERSAEREVAERERSGERTEFGAHSPLKADNNFN